MDGKKQKNTRLSSVQNLTSGKTVHYSRNALNAPRGVHTVEAEVLCMNILVTGFEPFGKETVNPSLEVLKNLPDTVLGADILKLEVPTVRGTSLSLITKAIEQWQPDAVLSIGQAGGRANVTVERIGINVDDYPISDNAGNQPIDEAVIPDAPAAYFLTLPVKAIVKRLRENLIPASISNTAGTFICNHVCYGTAHFAASQPKKIKTGFIHIPFLPEQVIEKPSWTPSMPLDTAVRAIIIAIEAIIENQTDISITGGAEC